MLEHNIKLDVIVLKPTAVMQFVSCVPCDPYDPCDPGSKPISLCLVVKLVLSSLQVDKLRNSIQALTRSANPLGKIMDYVQEDLHSMQKERDMWRAENSKLTMQIKEEMGWVVLLCVSVYASA